MLTLEPKTHHRKDANTAEKLENWFAEPVWDPRSFAKSRNRDGKMFASHEKSVYMRRSGHSIEWTALVAPFGILRPAAQKLSTP